MIYKTSSDTYNVLTIIENKLKMRKLQAPKVKGVQELKKTNHQTTKADSQTFKKFLVCCYVVIRVEK